MWENQGRGLLLAETKARLITFTETLIIPHITNLIQQLFYRTFQEKDINEANV